MEIETSTLTRRPTSSPLTFGSDEFYSNSGSYTTLPTKISLALVPTFTISIHLFVKNPLFLMINGTLLHQNGEPVTLEPLYRDLFFDIVNGRSGNAGRVSSSNFTAETESEQHSQTQSDGYFQRKLPSLRYEYDWELMQIKFVGKIPFSSNSFNQSCSVKETHAEEQFLNYTVNSVTDHVKQTSRSLQIGLEIVGLKTSRSRISVDIQKRKTLKKQMIYEIISNKLPVEDYFMEVMQFRDSEQNNLSSEKIDQEIQSAILELSSFTIHQENRSSQSRSPLTQKKKVHQGGYFDICKEKVTIIDAESGVKSIKNLAVKKLKSPVKSQKYRTNEEKVQNEYRIVSKIKNKKHILQYYRAANSQANNIILMDYEDYTLKDYLKFNPYIDIHQIIDFSKQLIKAVLHLHESGIVHRDLKPSNILLHKSDPTENSRRRTSLLKIIDFSESTLNTDVYDPQNLTNLGCTPPYSPLECAQNSLSGFNSFQIDYWSIGIIIFELMFRRPPICYCRCFGPDIMKAWYRDFYIPLHLGKRTGITFVETVFKFIVVELVKTDPKKRMRLEKVHKILQVLEEFVKQMEDI